MRMTHDRNAPRLRFGCTAVLLLQVAALACSNQPAVPAGAGSTLKFRLASQFPRETFLAASTRLFEEELKTAFGDRLTIDSYYGGSIMGPEETLDAIGQGTVDGGTGLWIYAPGRVPLGGFDNSFIFNDPNARTQARIKRAMFETIPALREELARANIAPPLLFAPNSPYVIMSRQPIRTFADLKGKRIGFTPTEYVPVFTAAGAVPVISPAGEFYERLELGVVDAVSVPVPILNAFRIYEVAPYLLDLEINTPTTFSLWINRDYWNRLDEADRDRFSGAGRRAETRYLDYLDEAVTIASDAMAKAGVTRTRLSNADLQRWVAAMPNIVREWQQKMEARGVPAGQVVKAYIELSEQEGWTFPIDYSR